MSAEFKSILFENIPCWYDLDLLVTKGKIGIVFKIHKDFLNFILEKYDMHKTPLVECIKEERKTEEFKFYINGNIGFYGILNKMKENEEFIEYVMYIENSKNDKNIFRKLVTNLYFMNRLLNISFEKETSSKLLQLATVDTCFRFDDEHFYNSHPMGGNISSYFVNYILKNFGWEKDDKRSNPFSYHIVEDVTNIMLKVHCKATGERINSKGLRHSQRELSCIITSGNYLSIRCIGNACDVGTYEEMKPDEGCEFSCHNLDSAYQQVVLFSGFAALCGKARRELSN